MAKSSSNIVAGTGAYNQHLGMARSEAQRQIIRIVLGRLFHNSGVPAQVFRRKVNDGLVPDVVDGHVGTGKISVRVVKTGELNLLIWSPQGEMIRRGGIMQQQGHGHDKGAHEQALPGSALQQGKSRQYRTQPEGGRQHQPAHGEEDQNARQAACQIPGISGEGIWRQIHLPADFLTNGHKDAYQKQQKQPGERHRGQKAAPIPGFPGTPDVEVGGGSQALRQTFHGGLMGPASEQQQPDERGCGGQPANGLAGQGAADAEAQEAEQERQIFEVSKYPNFNRQPADKSQLSKEGKKTRQEKFKQTPAIAGGVRQKKFLVFSPHPDEEKAVPEQQTGG